MEHIRTPVTSDVRWGAWIVFDAAGQEVVRALDDMPSAGQVSRQVAAVLNAHDALIAQRDALMRIAEAVLQVRDDWYPFKVPGYLQRLAARAEGALALVEAADA